MKTNEQWAKELYASIEQDPVYIAEGIALDFIRSCENRRAELGWSYAELARRMDVSRQHVHKVMTGTQNSTIGSLVKLALALGCELKLDLTVVAPTNGNRLPVANTNGLHGKNPT